MSFQPDRSIRIELNINASQPELLEGLEALLRLGLISNAQVKQLSRQYLCCVLPEPVLVVEPEVPIPARSQPSQPVVAVPIESASPKTPTSPNLISRSLQSLMAELSVRWLLFLGVFMVVVSSGLLAASQWEKFPAFAQYGVLLAYTIIFWAVSQWATAQPNLNLTAQTLQIVTLLLVPVNFWAMDGFRLWSNPLEWLTVAIATIALTAITAILFKNQPHLSRLSLINNLGLSYLHWGWGWVGFPLIAVYIGTILTAIATFFQLQSRQGINSLTNSENQSSKNLQKYKLLGTALVGYALAILLFRAIFLAGVAIAQLGLAIGICGWIFLKLSQQEEGREEKGEGKREKGEFQVWELLGGGLLILGWGVSVQTEPAQAIAVSALSLWWFADRLRCYWHKVDLIAIFVIVLQAFWLVWRLIPGEIQKSAIATGIKLFSLPTDAPGALFSLALFPYAIFVVWMADWLHRRQKLELANLGETLALGLGTFLTVISAFSPLLRSLNLFAYTLTLGVVTIRRSPLKSLLVYLTHVTGLLAATSSIDWIFPTLNTNLWASILLALMLAEWLFVAVIKDESGKINLNSDFRLPPSIIQSAWHLGLVLAGLSYALLWINYTGSLLNSDVSRPVWGIIWIIVPIALTGMAFNSEPQLRSLSSWLSITGAIAAQLLTLEVPKIRLINLAIVSVVTFFNVQALQSVTAAAISVGFGLCFVGALLWEGIPGLLQVSNTEWFVVGAIACVILWLLRALLRGNSSTDSSAEGLKDIYAKALDNWAIALCGLELVILTFYSLNLFTADRPSVIAAIVLMGATSYRSWQFPRSHQASWLSVLVLGIAQVTVLPLSGFRVISLGIAAILMFLHARYLRLVSAATIAVGFTLSCLFMLLWEGIPGLPRLLAEGWLVTVAGTVTALWLVRSYLMRRSDAIATIYAPATDYWAIALCGINLGVLTFHSLTVYWGFVNPSVAAIVATVLTMSAIVYRGWQHPSNWIIYSVGWSLEILAAEALGFVGKQLVYLAIANIALGLIAQLAGDWWRRRTNRNDLANSWNVMPLLYGGLGAALRWNTFANWTGLTSLGLALIAIGVGRRREQFKPLVYLAMIGVSISAYEILWYQLLQMPKGGAIGDGLIAMATLGTSIMYAYRVLTPWLLDYLRLTREEIKIAADMHWVLSSCLLMATLVTPIASSTFLGLGTGIFLIRYAIFQARHNPNSRAAETWFYLGLLEAAGLRLYWLSTPIALAFSGPLAAWKVATTCVGALILYALPWEKWGWPKRPVLVAACVWPLVMAWESKDIIHPVALLIAAGFYVLLAKTERQIRLTYLSALLINWALLRWFVNLNVTDNLAYVAPPAFSLLYVTQVDPSFKKPEEKMTRHVLRIIGTAAICLMAFLTSNWFVAGFLSLMAIFAGLTLRVRAFLYVGTAAFLLNAINQLIILNQEYSFVKWVIGLVMGSAFIWIAANFETRREQIAALVQNWMAELEEWE